MYHQIIKSITEITGIKMRRGRKIAKQFKKEHKKEGSDGDNNKPGGTMQKSEVNKQTFRSRMSDRISFLTYLNHQLFKNIAYVGYF